MSYSAEFFDYIGRNAYRITKNECIYPPPSPSGIAQPTLKGPAVIRIIPVEAGAIVEGPGNYRVYFNSTYPADIISNCIH